MAAGFLSCLRFCSHSLSAANVVHHRRKSNCVTHHFPFFYLLFLINAKGSTRCDSRRSLKENACRKVGMRVSLPDVSARENSSHRWKAEFRDVTLNLPSCFFVVDDERRFRSFIIIAFLSNSRGSRSRWYTVYNRIYHIGFSIYNRAVFYRAARRFSERGEINRSREKLLRRARNCSDRMKFAFDICTGELCPFPRRVSFLVALNVDIVNQHPLYLTWRPQRPGIGCQKGEHSCPADMSACSVMPVSLQDILVNISMTFSKIADMVAWKIY